NTPKPAMKVMIEPMSTKNADNHINMSISPAFAGSAFYEGRESYGSQKAYQGNAKDYVNERHGPAHDGGQVGHADSEHAQHIQSNDSIARVGAAYDSYASQDHGDKQHKFADLKGDRKYGMYH